MKKILKLTLILILLVIFVFIMFIIEESIRLENNPDSRPLIIIAKIMCSKDDIIFYNDDGKYTEEYWSLGFVLKLDYYLDERSSEDNLIYHLVGEEFKLFNKFRIWAWIS